MTLSHEDVSRFGELAIRKVLLAVMVLRRARNVSQEYLLQASFGRAFLKAPQFMKIYSHGLAVMECALLI